MRGLRSYLAAALAMGFGSVDQGSKWFFIPRTFKPKPTKSKHSRVSQKKRRLNARRLNKY